MHNTCFGFVFPVQCLCLDEFIPNSDNACQKRILITCIVFMYIFEIFSIYSAVNTSQIISTKSLEQ